MGAKAQVLGHCELVSVPMALDIFLAHVGLVCRVRLTLVSASPLLL